MTIMHAAAPQKCPALLLHVGLNLGTDIRPNSPRAANRTGWHEKRCLLGIWILLEKPMNAAEPE